MFISIFNAIFIFFVVVFFHELGHFATAKFFKVKVNEFFLGFGPILVKKQIGETLYSLRAFPLGGAVSMEGEDSESDHERSFFRLASWKKILIVFAGPFMNFVVTFVFLFIFLLLFKIPTNEVSYVKPDSPASKYIEVGDIIVKIGNDSIQNFDDIKNSIAKSEGKALNIEVKRGKENKIFTITPVKEDNHYILGVSSLERHSLNPYESFLGACKLMKNITLKIFEVLSNIFTDKEIVKTVSGPIGIYRVIDHFSGKGFLQIIFLTAIISLNLGLMNLLPIPVLDGGRILFLLFELILGIKINKKLEESIQTACFLLLIAILIVVSIKDVLFPVDLPS